MNTAKCSDGQQRVVVRDDAREESEQECDFCCELGSQRDESS